MGTPVTINVRLPEKLKEHGGQVLDRCGVSPSEIVRSVYRYMEKNQEIPPCLDVASPAGATTEDKRRMLRKLVSPTPETATASGVGNHDTSSSR